MLPRNVLRPDATSWQPAWGDMAIPEGHGGDAVEIGQILELEGLGACLLALPSGMRSCPLHHHHFDEEVFFVVDGELTVRELAPGASRYTEYVLRAGELVVYPPGTGVAHQSTSGG